MGASSKPGAIQIANLNRLDRVDEKPFEAVAHVSEFNQRAYELFARPLVQSIASDFSAKLMRDMHPLRMQRSAISDQNPLFAWLAPAAAAVKAMRQPLAANTPPRQIEKCYAEIVSAALDYYRGVRDASSEAAFFNTYGTIFALRGDALLARDDSAPTAEADTADARKQPFVEEALESITEGGFNAAFARVAVLLSRKGHLPLARLVMRQEIAHDYADVLPQMEPDAWRRLRGEQEIIATYAPDKALATLPDLLPGAADRARLLSLIDRLLADERVMNAAPTPEQLAMLASVREVLETKRKAPARKRNNPATTQ